MGDYRNLFKYDDQPILVSDDRGNPVGEISAGAMMHEIGGIENPGGETGQSVNSPVAALRAEVDRLRSERDRLIDGCIAECWRARHRPASYAEAISGVITAVPGWEWRYGPCVEFAPTKAEAVAAVRKAAGLDPGED